MFFFLFLFNVKFTQNTLKFFFVLTGGKLLYNVVLVSAVQQCKSVIIIYIISLLSLPPLHPFHSSGEPGCAPGVIYQLLTSYLFYTRKCIFANATFSICPTLSLPHWVHSLFSVSAPPFLPCTWVHQYHFSRFHICVLIYHICFSLYDISLCITGCI